MASYSTHVLIATGKDDWSSRIENEQSDAGHFIRALRGLIGKGSKSFDPFNNIMATTSSLPASAKPQTTTALLFPSFKRIPAVPHTADATADFATAFLKARELHPMHDGLSAEHKSLLLRDESRASTLPPAEPINKLLVLICGHGGRDERCGILGPILRTQFEEEFARRRIDADVALISHIGGHKYAGNIIMYIPPTSSESDNDALKGCGVWYGRVGPEHVEGLVEETIIKGHVVGDLFRGGITKDGGNLGYLVADQLQRVDGAQQNSLRMSPRSR